jgi:alpha-methylacyl-CoA racemase
MAVTFATASERFGYDLSGGSMGPLQGIRIIEVAGIGPTQFCGMLLADMGATVIRIVRPDTTDVGVGLPDRFNLMNRSRPAVAVELKSAAGIETVLKLCESADALFEGFRPGVMERLGLGPDICGQKNKRLVYGRMTGWGQGGPLAGSVGHDINYAALSGALGAIGEKNSSPVVPLNLVADFGGGGAYLAIGILAAILEASRSGAGQVVDAAMIDGAASLMTLFYGMHAGGLWRDERGSNFLDGAAPFYRSYRTSDDRFVVVGAIEPRFFAELLETLGLTDISPADQYNQAEWKSQAEIFEAIFATRTRDAWCEIFSEKNACFAPVLSLEEAPLHEHNRERGTFVEIEGVIQPGPAPRFSRTGSEVSSGPARPKADNRDVLADWGFTDAEFQDLKSAGAFGPI